MALLARSCLAGCCCSDVEVRCQRSLFFNQTVCKSCIAPFFFQIRSRRFARRHTFSKSVYALCEAPHVFQIRSCALHSAIRFPTQSMQRCIALYVFKIPLCNFFWFLIFYQSLQTWIYSGIIFKFITPSLKTYILCLELAFKKLSLLLLSCCSSLVVKRSPNS